ncbi:MAG TPA: N,N-dimethylformamidase beta subunit family domain-containing protein [Kineosporiaceae bacterium]|nr:N,N-dimethylformamidase beta subunit family domain-containing protein [Kineosporiaceae bacterium]
MPDTAAGATGPGRGARGIRVFGLAAALAALVLAGCSGPATPTGAGTSAPRPATPGTPTHQPTGLAGADPTTPAGWAAAVAAENALPGTRAWWPSVAGDRPGVEAFTDRVSVRPGDKVGLYVDADGPVSLTALRIGWYAGAGSRQIWQGPAVAHKQPAKATLSQPLADLGGMKGTRAIVAPWQLTTLLDTAGWPEGRYLIRVERGGAVRVVPLTVRSADAHGRVLLVAATMTWQAYNLWGGASLYEGGSDESFGNRSFAVSYDRPYADGYGAGHYFSHDLGLDQVAEQDAIPLAWTTDYDLAQNPKLLDGATAIVFGGHAEYWTGSERDSVTAAVAKGSNLAIFGANTAYWRVRLAGREVGLPGQPDRRNAEPRLVVGAKSSSLDPLAAGDPAGAMARFRDKPAPRPEEALTGMRYDCFPAEAALTVSDANWWGWAGTGLKNGDTLPKVVAPESDRVYPAPDLPHPMQVVAYTKFSCRGNQTAQTSVYWVAPSGAGVFVAGTMNWPCAARALCTLPGQDRAETVMTRVTRNILVAFAIPQVGRAKPPADNVGQFWLPPRNTTGAA